MQFSIFLTFILFSASFVYSETSRPKRDSLSDQSVALLDSAAEEASGESSGIDSSDIESSGEGSGIDDGVPIDAVTLKQLGLLNTYAQQVQAESQKLIHQANLVITQMTTLSTSAQNLGALSTIVSTNSEKIYQNAETSLNGTHPEQLRCTPSSVCYDDNGCGSGKCIGALAGTCNCNACVYGWPCQNDSACGGFNGACNNVTATCDCYAAYNHNNYTLTTALTSFCNVKKCNGTNHANNCFGLPCNYGFCVC